jgi:hypothetical protein
MWVWSRRTKQVRDVPCRIVMLALVNILVYLLGMLMAACAIIQVEKILIKLEIIWKDCNISNLYILAIDLKFQINVLFSS